MAVKINNEYAIRKAQRWNENDDAALAELVHKKIKEVNIAIREANTPYTRAKLKAKRAHYKDMAKKIDSGTYNGDIIFSEMQAAAALRSEREYNIKSYLHPMHAKKYLNSYEDMDFDYEHYFRKSRYYGVALPILLTLLTCIFIAFFILSAILPAATKNTLEENGFAVTYMYSFKIGKDAEDFRVINDGNWPEGTWKYVDGVEQKLEQGTKYINSENIEPEYVLLYENLGMRTIEISAFDITKAWFRTKMLSKTKLDFIEDNSNFQGTSWFYAEFLDSRADNIAIEKNADGKYDVGNIIRHISTYGSILFLIFAFICGLISLIINLLRIFTYTTRRLHTFSWLCFLFYSLALILPAFMQMEGTDIATAFTNYFIFDYVTFAASESMLSINILASIPAGAALLMLLLPKIFRNRLKKLPTFVPSGNRPRKYDEDMVYGAYSRRK